MNAYHHTERDGNGQYYFDCQHIRSEELSTENAILKHEIKLLKEKLSTVEDLRKELDKFEMEVSKLVQQSRELMFELNLVSIGV